MADARFLARSNDGAEIEVKVLFNPLLLQTPSAAEQLVQADKVKLPSGKTAWVYVDGLHFYEPDYRKEFSLQF